MTDLMLILAVAAVTYSSRVAFLIRPRPVPGGALGRFLDVFPLALFVAIATVGLATPEGSPAVTPGLAAAAGGVLGGIAFRRSLVGILVVGAASFYLVRALLGS
ncbi:MAG TPA: AzlD domain-containing protein [Acidimicrobiia bacterium]|nr:AzlD domain-containing protein [Acidimicrobiia bacterium]